MSEIQHRGQQEEETSPRSQNWFASEDELSNTPSRKDGIDAETETLLRIYGCEVIQEAGILLKLPQVVMATAQVLYHRFYFRRSFRRFDARDSVMAALFLATKTEEKERKIRDVINTFHYIFEKREGNKWVPLDVTAKPYWTMKSTLIRTERYLLKEMGFRLYVEHPHKYILAYTKVLGVEDDRLRQQSWNLLNDSLRTTACVRFTPETIAVASIYLAARFQQIPFPEHPSPWWELFDATLEDIQQIVAMILDLYLRPKAIYLSVVDETLASNLADEPKLTIGEYHPPPPLSLYTGVPSPPATTTTTTTTTATDTNASAGPLPPSVSSKSSPTTDKKREVETTRQMQKEEEKQSKAWWPSHPLTKDESEIPPLRVPLQQQDIDAMMIASPPPNPHASYSSSASSSVYYSKLRRSYSRSRSRSLSGSRSRSRSRSGSYSRSPRSSPSRSPSRSPSYSPRESPRGRRGYDRGHYKDRYHHSERYRDRDRDRDRDRNRNRDGDRNRYKGEESTRYRDMDRHRDRDRGRDQGGDRRDRGRDTDRERDDRRREESRRGRESDRHVRYKD